jgi:hypothetical protein
VTEPDATGPSPATIGPHDASSHAHGALSQLLFQTGRWDDALAEAGILPEDVKEDGGACSELGIAAVISFHRGDAVAARRHLAAAAPHAGRLERRLAGLLALARSLDRSMTARCRRRWPR